MFIGMGCVQCRLSPFSASAQKMRNTSEEKTYSWDKRREIDAKDYTIEDVKATVVGRTPGTVNGQQIIIQNCEDSSIYVLDHLNTVIIDDCVNCNIILGPTKGRQVL